MMRFLTTFLCLFLLLLSVGTLTYIYLIWTTYWQRIAKLTKENNLHGYHSVVRLKYDDTTGKFVANDADTQRFIEYRRRKFHDYENGDDDNGEDEFFPINNGDESEELNKYEKKIIGQLRSTVIETGKSVQVGEIKNSYHVNYNGKKAPLLKSSRPPAMLICDAKRKVSIRTFQKGDYFFRKQDLDKFFSESQLLHAQTFNSCAVVSSAGSLKGSNLGSVIDSHDFIIRFNNAPTVNFEKDVGSKTHLRIINSQVVGKPQFKFLESRAKMYSSSPVLVWDPCAYNATLSDWYQNPDYPFFETFFSKRLMRPNEETHLLQPSSLWSLWDWLQSQSKWPLLPNPPSSGFLGLMIAVQHCHTVRIFEYVPSMRLTKRCHYYDEEENLGCTLGDWHPLAAEKLMAIALNKGRKKEVFDKGYITIPGYLSIECPSIPDEFNENE